MDDRISSDENASSEIESPMSMDGLYFAVRGRLGDYVAYPIGVEGVVIGQGETFDAALERAKSATQFHIETFGAETMSASQTEPETS